MRRIVAAFLIFCLLGPLPWTVRQQVAGGEGQAIRAVAVAVPAAARGTGALTLGEAWALESPNARFGGLSGLALTGPRRFLIVSDQGMRVSFALPARGGWVKNARIAPIAGMATNGRKALSDAEAVFHDERAGQSWVSFEIMPQIIRIDERRGAVAARIHPRAMKNWPENRGPEAMTRLADGRFLVFSEGADTDPRGNEALIFAGDPTVPGPPPVRFFYDTGGRGQVTDAATLPDGRLLLLHRRVNWWGFVRGRGGYVSTIALADPAELAAGSVLRGTAILRIGPPGLSDNFEGMALAPGGDSGDRHLALWLVADDNFNGWQDNLLVRYRLDLTKLPPRAAR